MRWKLSIFILCVFFGLSGPAFAQAESPQRTAGLNTVTSLQVNERDDGTYIHLEGTQVPTFSVFRLNDPLRLFVDISNSQLKGESLSQSVGNGVISQVALIEFEDSFQSVARLIIGFDQGAHYDVRTEGNKVVVFVDGAQRKKPASASRVEQELERKQLELAQAENRLKLMEQRYRSELEQNKSSHQRAVAELEQTRQRLQESQAEMRKMNTELSSATGAERRRLELAIAEKNRSLQVAQQEVTRNEGAVAQLSTQLDKLKQERDAGLARVAELESEREQALKLVRAKEQEGLQARKHAQELEGRLHKTEAQLQAIATEKEDFRARVEIMVRQVEASTGRVEAQVGQLEEARRREAQLEQQLSTLRASVAAGDKGAQSSVDELEGERARWQEKLQDYTAELERSEKDSQLAQRRLDELSKVVAQRDAEIAQLRGAQQNNSASDNDRQAQRDLELAQSRLKALQAQLAEASKARQALPAARAVPVDPSSTNSVRAIRLETSEQGRSRIVVELERPGRFETRPSKDSRAVMILNDVVLPKHLEQTLSGDAQGGAVRFVSSFVEHQGQVRLEAELTSDASDSIRQEGNQLVWEFASSVAQAGPGFKNEARPARTADGESFTSAPPGYRRGTSVPGMSRKRLTIDLRNADIQNVLRLMAKEGGVNIIASDDVKGTVTMRLRGVPLDQVFLTILQSLQLGYEVRGNVIRVAPQSVLAAEEAARAEARTRAQRIQPLEVFLLPINYATAGDLVTQVQGLLSPRGSVTVDARTNTLIIKDLRETLDSIRILIESLDSQVPQVLIEARIVETNDTFARQIGIQWGGDLSFSQGNGNPTGLIFPNVLGLGGGATDGQTPTQGTSSNPNFAVNLPAPAGTGAGGAIGLTMGSVGGGVNLNLRLSAMEEAGHAKIVSSPKILTLDNRQATISQGTSIPISVVSAAGVQTVFVDATLELTVTPHVTPDGNVQLKIMATKNEPDFQNTGARGDPTIIRRQAETELLIRDGDTTVIGGIYTRNAGRSIAAVPFFHRIPILGFFFRTSSESERRSELLIFITPRIVNRAEALGVLSAGTLSADPDLSGDSL